MEPRMMQLFIGCSENFINNNTDLILSGVSERCLCGALMIQFRYALDASDLNAYYSDVEYNRNFDGRIKTIIDDQMEIFNITCDLIIHSRGDIPEQDNLIAIEMKRDFHLEEEKTKDRNRLRALTRATNDPRAFSADGITFPENVCGYIIGVFYEISIPNRRVNIEYYRQGELFTSYVRNF